MSEVVLFSVRDHVATITLNRPEALNAMNRELGQGLMAALRRVREEDDIRVAILTGNGRAFCAGADLKERAAAGVGGGTAGSSVTAFLDGIFGESFSRMTMPKPLLAAINGHCLAGGLELALTCDIRIASPAATFGLPEITRGFFPGAGGPQRLPRAIPQSLAMEMILTGDPIDAERALQGGLVSRVVDAPELLTTATSIARRIAEHAPLAVRAVKEVALAAPDLTLDQSLRFGSALRWVIGQTEDALEGPRAFSEKRAPTYKGR
jgi:enoyl-CoA hydratase/carnithine racemase